LAVEEDHLMSNGNSAAALFAGGIVRTFELLSLRGAPTLLRLLDKIPAFHDAMATAPLGKNRMKFQAFDAYWCRYLWAGVPFEGDVAQVFRKLGTGSILIDCGANIGYWSVRAPEFGFTHVVAVEANCELIPMLRNNLELNGVPSEVIHAAIYSRTGEQLFLDRTAAHAEGTLGEKGLPVTSITIADIARRQRDTEILAKLDVEGAELAAIDGASGVDRITFVYEDFPREGMRVTEELLRRGFKVFGVAPSGECRTIANVGEALAFNARFAIPRWPSNLVACRPERGGWLERKLRGGGPT
jgi:FkbM family methyltransferase